MYLLRHCHSTLTVVAVVPAAVAARDVAVSRVVADLGLKAEGVETAVPVDRITPEVVVEAPGDATVDDPQPLQPFQVVGLINLVRTSPQWLN